MYTHQHQSHPLYCYCAILCFLGASCGALLKTHVRIQIKNQRKLIDKYTCPLHHIFASIQCSQVPFVLCILGTSIAPLEWQIKKSTSWSQILPVLLKRKVRAWYDLQVIKTIKIWHFLKVFYEHFIKNIDQLLEVVYNHNYSHIWKKSLKFTYYYWSVKIELHPGASSLSY